MASENPELIPNELYGRIILPEHLPELTSETDKTVHVVDDYNLRNPDSNQKLTLKEHELFAFNALLLSRNRGPLAPTDLLEPMSGQSYHPNADNALRRETVSKVLARLMKKVEDKLNMPDLLIRSEKSKRSITYHIGENILIDQSGRKPSTLITPVDLPAYRPRKTLQKEFNQDQLRFPTMIDGYLEGKESAHRLADELVDTAIELERQTGSQDAILARLKWIRKRKDFSGFNDDDDMSKIIGIAERTVLRLRSRVVASSRNPRTYIKT